MIETEHGSRLYGTALPTSDHDRVVVFEEKMPTTKDPEVEYKFFSWETFQEMLEEGQVLATELLFVTPERALRMSKWWEENVYAKRKELLVPNSYHNLAGYARRESARYRYNPERLECVGTISDWFAARQGIQQPTQNVPRWFHTECDSSHGKMTRLQKAETRKCWPWTYTVGDLEAELKLRIAELPELQQVFVEWETDFLRVCGRRFPKTVKADYIATELRNLANNYHQRQLHNTTPNWKQVYDCLRAALMLEELKETGELKFPLTYSDYLLQVRTGAVELKVAVSRIDDILSRCL